MPRSWSIVAGMPSPTAATPGRASRASSTSRTSSSTSSSSVWPVERLAALPERPSSRRRGRRRSIFVPPRSTPIVSPAAHARASSGGWRRATAGIGMISSLSWPTNGEQRPSGPPEYKVYRSRKGLFSRLRKPDLSGLRERATARAEAAAARTASRAGPDAAAAAAAAGRQAGPQMGRRSRPLGWILLSFLAFAVSAQLQSFKLSGEAQGRPARQPLPAAQRRRRSSSSAPTPARPTPRSRARRPRRSASSSRRTATRRTATARRASSAPTR